MRWILPATALAVLLLLPAAAAGQVDRIDLRSPAFEAGGEIPLRHSAYGDNISPELAWSGLPDGTRSLALVLEDPDAPTPQAFVHWVVYEIPADAGGLPEGLPPRTSLDSPQEIAGTTQGLTGLGDPGYFGPRPPAGDGEHRYVFTLYALDADLDLEDGLTRGELMREIEPHILIQGELTGTFEREE